MNKIQGFKMNQAHRAKQLFEEFKQLKQELFGESMFVVLNEDSAKVRRYDQLLGLFYPELRANGWKNPIKGA